MKRKLLISAAALLVAAGGALVVIEVVPAVRLGVKMRRHAQEAIRREPQVMAAWKREFGVPAALLARYPQEPDDQTALRLMEFGPKFEKSRLRDARWIYSVTPEGHLSIALSRPVDWGSTVGLVLPVRYEAEWVAGGLP